MADYTCFECGRRAEHEHHVVPQVRGGTKTVPLCTECHGKVHGNKMASVQLIKEGLRKAAERGVFPGRKFYGETAEQRAVIETVVTLAIEKKRLRKIADYLNEKGIKTRLGRQWYPTQIKNILDREKEAGRIRKRRYAGIPYWERVEPESENGFEKNWYEI